ncbi:hypothetical protein B0O99DRAFT_682279 [Bisporella sp. PMI_857]|nr:hypothetical protein B0O99DRAFT_682710 [Bisporella sp. PMI_857]KAH8600590.1 hypothetical protein B0O99DRAFT_682279 [Bisporella sp. PMI_857]
MLATSQKTVRNWDGGKGNGNVHYMGGGLFDSANSPTWTQTKAEAIENQFALSLNTQFGYGGVGKYGFDTVGLGYDPSQGPTLPQQIVSEIVSQRCTSASQNNYGGNGNGTTIPGSNGSSGNKLNGGAIAGIVIAVLAVIAVARSVIACFWFGWLCFPGPLHKDSRPSTPVAEIDTSRRIEPAGLSVYESQASAYISEVSGKDAKVEIQGNAIMHPQELGAEGPMPPGTIQVNVTMARAIVRAGPRHWGELHEPHHRAPAEDANGRTGSAGTRARIRDYKYGRAGGA